MNLTDRAVLELNDLCGAVADGTLTETQRVRLAAMLRQSEAARRYYVRALGQSASLYTYAAEIHADAPERIRAERPWRAWLLWAAVFPAVAALVAGFFFAYHDARNVAGPAATRMLPFVARLTAAKDVNWTHRERGRQPGRSLRQGQRFELASGYAEITFDCGARVVLEGAASLDINSAWDATLRRGTAKVSVPPEALGFRLSSPAVEVVDLGTEFSMTAEGNGAAEVLVLRGEVEAAPHGGSDPDVIRLRQNESRRFDPSGVSRVSDSERKFARLAAPLDLEPYTRVANWAHWSFDENDGAVIHASEERGASGSALRLRDNPRGESAAMRAQGRHGQSLRFDGRTYAEAKFAGISDPHHTVAFWVRVAKDAPLSEAYSMVTWMPNSPKLAHRPVGINWNRDPVEGPVGALRTDFAGGCAMGATSLRDGAWHHVAVCFALAEDTGGVPVEVKQYVDGRLESSGIVPGRTRGPAGAEDPTLADIVWLGCRLKPNGPQQQRFRGELDELFIADRLLEPAEIVHLMRANEMPESTVARR